LDIERKLEDKRGRTATHSVLSFLRSLLAVFFAKEKCNEMMRWISLINKLFSELNISQGSVATRLRCGGIHCIECYIAHFLEIITVKEFLKLGNI